MDRPTVTPNALGFDVEHWHMATLLRSHVDCPEEHIRDSVEIVLETLAAHDVRATFFVVGRVAEEYPATVARIDEAGHELGSHGHTHTPITNLSRQAFRRELRDSRAAIEAATGTTPVGFRAANFSVDAETTWGLPEICAAGYRYDSSVFPVRTPIYGVADAPIRPYRVNPERPFQAIAGASDGLVEFPLSVAGEMVRIPIAGGFYARLLPVELLLSGIERLNRLGIPANMYFHPWEFNPAVRTDRPPLHKRFISFYGIERLREKLERLLESSEFEPLGSVLQHEGLLDTSRHPTDCPWGTGA